MKKNTKQNRKAYRAYIRERFIEEYKKDQDMTEEERAWRITNVDHLVDIFMGIADRTQMIPTKDGVIFVTDGEQEYIPAGELDG